MTETLEVYDTMNGSLIVSLVEEDAPLVTIAPLDRRYLPQILAVLSQYVEAGGR